MTETEPLYSVTQQAVLALIPPFTGTLSVLSSIAIIFIILKDRKKKLSHVYHRLVFAMSCLDLMNSINYALSSLVVPKGTPGVWGSQGTVATCAVSGFAMQFGISVPLYSGCLALYYLLMIRFRIKERVVAKRVEPFMHIISIGYPLVSAIIPFMYEMYNPMTTQVGWCFLNDFPSDCTVNPNVECSRGENYEDLMLYSTMLPVTANFLLIIFCMTMISAYVWRQGRNSSRWMLRQSGVNHSRETLKQGALYIFFFWLTFIWQLSVIFTSKELTSENRKFYFGFVVMIKTFLPLQGFWNFFIYVRPRYNAISVVYSEASSYTIFKSLFTGEIEGNSLILSRSRTFASRHSQAKSYASRASDTDGGTAELHGSEDLYTPELQAENADASQQPRIQSTEQSDIEMAGI